MKTTDKISCRIIADLLAQTGVKDVVLSPGSRNTPLILAMDAEERLRKHVIIDERTAAFFALGMASASGRPVALICTSGSAVLNYGPAVAEAFYRGIPLIVISADRPLQWIDQDDSQTIRQFRIFDNIVKKSYDLLDLPEESPEYEWYVNRIVNDALIEARKPFAGPVHINLQLDTPLSRLKEIDRPDSRVISYIGASQKISGETVKELTSRLEGKRILLIAGFMQPNDKLQRAVAKFASLPQVAVMAETISNLHLAPDAYSIDSVLSTMSAAEKEALRPDIVITIGGALVSRMIKDYLRQDPPAQHWAIGHKHTTVDCFKALTLRIDIEPAYLLRKLFNQLVRTQSASTYSLDWKQRRSVAAKSADDFISQTDWCELRAFRTIFETLPSGINLHLSNGTPIRYNQLLARSAYHTTYCNRGVSGIDGCTSTAIGAAVASTAPTLLITGDMAFSYDLSALAVNEIPPDFKIIVINNAGGGIFRFVGTTRDLVCREKYFCAAPAIDYAHLARAFGFNYLRADNEDALREIMHGIRGDESAPTIIEVVVDGHYSAEQLTNFMNR